MDNENFWVWTLFFVLLSISLIVFFFFKKLSQSFLSLSEIFLINYVMVLINSQLGLDELISFAKTHVS